MSEKELLYIEDVLEHLNDLEKICNYYVSITKEKDIQKILKNIIQISTNNYNEFYTLFNL